MASLDVSVSDMLETMRSGGALGCNLEDVPVILRGNITDLVTAGLVSHAAENVVFLRAILGPQITETGT